jgi:hypothetical protein
MKESDRINSSLLLTGVTLLLLIFVSPVWSQIQVQKDLFDIFSDAGKQEIAEPELKKLYWPILPIISYSPANGFVLGAGIAPSILLDSASHTRISSGLANFQVTSLRQLNFNFRHNIYLSHDAWIFLGDWRLLFFSQPTYGLGINEFPGAFSLNSMNLTEENGAQPMRFNYFRFHETALRQIQGRLYGGIGLAIDYHFNIRDELLDLEANPPFYTSHFVYCKSLAFSETRYSNNGIIFRSIFDSRDNPINAYRGWYADLGLRLNRNWMGSTKNSGQFYSEARAFVKLSDKTRLAFWYMGSYLLSGTVPYLALPSLGWDTYNRSGRGYVQGRFRGENLVYTEAELRYGITDNGLIGGVFFANVTTTDNRFLDQNLFEDYAFGFGAGLRVKMNKESRTNICVDLGIGQYNSSGVYFGLQEAF